MSATLISNLCARFLVETVTGFGKSSQKKVQKFPNITDQSKYARDLTSSRNDDTPVWRHQDMYMLRSNSSDKLWA